MTLKKVFNAILEERTANTKTKFVAEVRKRSKTRKAPAAIFEALIQYVLEEAFNDIAINFEENKIVYRENLFRETQFTIQPTNHELERKMMVLGHRLLPFVHPNVSPTELIFEDGDGQIIPIREITLPVEEGQDYVLLMAPYGALQLDIQIHEKMLMLWALDLEAWLKNHKVGKKDLLQITPIDYDKHRFRFDVLSSREIAEQAFVTKRMDEILTESLIEIIEFFETPIPVDYCLFWAFANLPKQNLPLVKVGSPIGPFLSNHEEINIFSENAFAYLHLHDFLDTFWESMMDEALFIDPSKMGKAKDLDGIFQELGNSYSSGFVAGKMIQQIHEHNQIDKQELIALLFLDPDFSFYNKKQERNFHAALDALEKKVNEEWSNTRLSLPMMQLLNKTIQFKVEFIAFLREIDLRLEDPANFDFASLMQFQPIDGMLDQLLEAIAAGEILKPKDAKGMTDQLLGAREQFHLFRDQFLMDL